MTLKSLTIKMLGTMRWNQLKACLSSEILFHTVNGARRVFQAARKSFQLSKFTTDPDELRQYCYDCVVIGSDVVWNYNIFGYDPLFFGRLNTARRLSFSKLWKCKSG